MIIPIVIGYGKFNLLLIIILFFFSVFVWTLFISLGLWLCTIVKSKKTSQMIVGWMNLFLLVVSGIMFPIQALPKWAQYVFMINLLTYVVDMIRYLMGGQMMLPLITNIIAITLFGVVAIFLGTFMYDRNLRR